MTTKFLPFAVLDEFSKKPEAMNKRKFEMLHGYKSKWKNYGKTTLLLHACLQASSNRNSPRIIWKAKASRVSLRRVLYKSSDAKCFCLFGLFFYYFDRKYFPSVHLWQLRNNISTDESYRAHNLSVQKNFKFSV